MTGASNAGRLVVLGDAALVAAAAAAWIESTLARAIATAGRATLALSGGNTPQGAYAILGQSRRVDWSRVDLFWVDERAVPPTDPRSNYGSALGALVSPAQIAPDRVHRMHAEAGDLEAEARAYEAVVRATVPSDATGRPAFDAMVLGVGDDGHTASLFPGDSSLSIREQCVVAVPAMRGLEARLTLTAPVIEAARHIAVLAVGASKRAPVARVLAATGDIAETPARIVRQASGEVVWFLDQGAAPARTP